MKKQLLLGLLAFGIIVSCKKTTVNQPGLDKVIAWKNWQDLFKTWNWKYDKGDQASLNCFINLSACSFVFIILCKEE